MHKSLPWLAPALSRVHPDWQSRLRPDILARIDHQLSERAAAGEQIYPQPVDIFNALRDTPPSGVRVVILGQDPYHGDGEACGLAFSVRRGIRVPPSLRNIYKELLRDTGTATPLHGDLGAWTRQGVLLLNGVLTVAANRAGSHRELGWQVITDDLIDLLAAEDSPRVFVLWGKDAQNKHARLTNPRHLVLQGPHPSPLSAYRGFFGCGHFSRINDYLREQGCVPIDWHLPE